jgi:hypothetical protein
MMCNHHSYERVTLEKVDQLVAACEKAETVEAKGMAAEHGFEP